MNKYRMDVHLMSGNILHFIIEGPDMESARRQYSLLSEKFVSINDIIINMNNVTHICLNELEDM